MTAPRPPEDDPAVRAVRRAVLAAIAEPGRAVGFPPARLSVADVLVGPDDGPEAVVQAADVPERDLGSDQVLVLHTDQLPEGWSDRLHRVPFLTLVVRGRTVTAVPPATDLSAWRLPSPP
jgi:hypothetical protein